MEISIPHTLGRDEAKRRIASRIGDISGFVPGGAAHLETDWVNDHNLTFALKAMGQAIDGRIAIEDDAVSVSLNLPPALSFVEPMVAPVIREKGTKLLEKSG